MTENENREDVINGLECCKQWSDACLYEGYQPANCGNCTREKTQMDVCECHEALLNDAINMLKAQGPRVMDVDEVAACEKGKVLWVEERQGVTWNLFPLEIEVISIHPDTGTTYLFFITYHDIRKFECDEYNQTWRCWTSRPTDAQREAVKWDA